MEAKKEKRKAEHDKLMGKTTDGAQEQEDDPNAIPLPSDPIAQRITKIEDISVAALRDKVLPLVDATIFSSQNLKAMKLSGTHFKEILLEVWEFTTGVCRSRPLGSDMRCFNKLGVWGGERAAERGRRALALTLPPDFDVQGLAEIGELLESGSLEVKHRFTGEVVHVAAKDLPPLQDGGHTNFSETKFAVTSTMVSDDSRRHLLCNYIKKTSTAHCEVHSTALFVTPRKKPRISEGSIDTPTGSSTSASPTSGVASVEGGRSISGDSVAEASDHGCCKGEEKTNESAGSVANIVEPAASIYDESIMAPPSPHEQQM